MSIHHLSIEHWHGNGNKNRKYQVGENGCDYCRKGSHAKCRPLLDDTFCTCTCARASKYRDDAAKLEGMTIQQKAVALAPRMRSVEYGDTVLLATRGHCNTEVDKTD
jgi:hypothetical protein